MLQIKKIFYIVLFLILSANSFAQVIDTCYVGESSVYRVRNQQAASWLYWEVSGGNIVSENPGKTDSVVVHWNTNAGIYELSIYEKTGNNCEGQFTVVEVMIIENDFDIELDIPNVFTPNQDGKNDYFTITANRPPENYRIIIVNRWGNKVFETENVNTNWDGKAKGRYCSPGVYYYVIHYKNGEKIETKNGALHIFR